MIKSISKQSGESCNNNNNNNRLSQLGSHDSLLLLRSPFSAPKVLHLIQSHTRRWPALTQS